MIAYFVILSVVLVYQLTKINNNTTSAPSNDDAVVAEDRLNNAVVFYDDSPVILSNKRQMIVDKTNSSYTPIFIDGKAYLPISFYSTVYGANVSGDRQNTSATIRLNNKALVVDSNEAVVVDNSSEKKIKDYTKPIICQNSVYVSADLFAEAYDKKVYINGQMGILSNAEFTEADNSFLNGLVSQVNDLPYVTNEANLKAIANISNTDDAFANIEKKIQEFETAHLAYDTNVQVLNPEYSDILLTDDKYIYYGGVGRVEILSRADEVKQVATIPTPNSFVTKKLILQNNKLIVIGDNPQQGDLEKGNVSTDVYIYDVADAANIKNGRTYSVSGYYRNAVIQGEYIYILSQNSVYGLYSDNKFNSPAYSDSLTGNDNISFEDIQYFPEIGSDDITIVSSFNLGNSNKPSVKAFMGAGANVYMSQSNFYVSKPRYTAFEDYDAVENNVLYRYSLSNGNLIKNGKSKIKGSLINPSAISEDNGYCRLVTQFTDSDKKVCNVYVLNNNLEICGQANEVAENDSIKSAVFCNNGILLTPSEVGGKMYSISLENPTIPEGKGALKLSNGNVVMYYYDNNTIITIDNGDGILKLGMYDISNLAEPKQLYSQELGKNENITTPLFEKTEGFVFDTERNTMIVPVKITGSSVFEGAYVYNVYKDEGINRIGTVVADGLKADCITKGKVLMISDDKAMVSDLSDVQKQTAIDFKKNKQ